MILGPVTIKNEQEKFNVLKDTFSSTDLACPVESYHLETSLDEEWTLTSIIRVDTETNTQGIAEPSLIVTGSMVFDHSLKVFATANGGATNFITV